MTPRSFVLAEVEELATNQARRCSVCRQIVRFLPRQPEFAMRAAGPAAGRIGAQRVCWLPIWSGLY